MKKAFWIAYVRLCLRPAVALLACAGVFAAVFALYGLPLGAVLYPTLLCTLGGAVFLLCHMLRSLRRCQALNRLTSETLHLLPVPASPMEQTYQTLLRKAVGEQTALRRKIECHYAELLETYTLWAHQIKTPIASMRLNLQNESGLLSRQLSEDLLRVEQYVEMALLLIKLDESGADYVLRECDLDALIRQAVRRLSSQFIRKKLLLSYDPIGARVVTDEKWLGFIIEQVLTNALKYTETGEIHIFWEAPQTLCIQDTGIGIAPEDLPRVFEKGYTGLNGRQHQRASGIGLYLCRRLCQRLGHTIRAESALGQGTVIRIGLEQRRMSE